MSDDDDDWFTRALRDDEVDDGGEGQTGESNGESGEESAGSAPESGDAAADPDPDHDHDPTAPADDDAPAAGGTFGFDVDEEAFEQDFASAFGDAPVPGDEGGGPGGPGGLGGAPAPGGFGGEALDEAELDSEIGRIQLGIEGLDEMILGGVPERSLIAAIGSAGTGKTTFGLQFLERALQQDERAVFITLEETRERVIRTADEKGWEFSEYSESDHLAVVDLDPVEMANNLSSIRSDLPDLIRDFGASRLVLDSVSLLEMMYDHPARRRSEVFEFARSLKRAGVTTLVTSEASQDDPYASRYGIIEYLADAVFVLQYVRSSDFQETRLAVEIQKIRDANHSRETKPYEITDEGMSVYRQANIF